jgi:biopolymer transport protein ExbD
MKFQRKKRENVDITLISMIDVLFVLLLFFMVSTTFNQHTEVSFKLPEAEGTESTEHPKSITLEIDADGVYSLVNEDGTTHQVTGQTRTDLKQELSKLPEQSKALPFIIIAADKTPTKSVIMALDIASQVGFSHATFQTVQPTD